MGKMYHDFTDEGSNKKEGQCLSLLTSLKQTAEWLLGSYSFNIWNTYGSLSRICTIVDEILSHGLNEKGPGKYWKFVCGLSQKEADKSSLLYDSELNGKNIKKEDKMLAHSWLQQSLMDHCLTLQLQALIQNESHIKEHYAENAFLRNHCYTNALLVYLNAIEQNQLSLLEDIDLNKIATSNARLKKQDTMIEVSVPTSCFNISDVKGSANVTSLSTIVSDTNRSSLAANPMSTASPRKLRNLNMRHHKKLANKKSDKLLKQQNSSISSTETLSPECSTYGKKFVLFTSSITKPPLQKSLSHSDIPPKPSNEISRANSYPMIDTKNCMFSDLKLENNGACYSGDLSKKELLTTSTLVGKSTTLDVRNKTTTESDPEPSSTETAWKAQHSRSKSDGTGVLSDRTSVNETHKTVEASLCASMPSILPDVEYQPARSILEGGTVVAPTECFFPRPLPGQTLMSFLSSDFNICAELDRENAHFCISEALISAIEQIKCTESMKIAVEEIESDEEIKKLTQRIRIRRRERLQEKAMKHTVLLSDGRTDTTTTSQSVSPMSTSHSSDFGTADSMGSEDEDVHDMELSDRNASNLTSMKESGLSLSMASMYSEADLHKGLFAYSSSIIEVVEKRLDADSSGVHLSAEAVALSLLKRFSEKQLPKASDLKWLVSEQEAPQRLLPLPDSWPIAPDAIDEEYDMEKTRLRGNMEWAPPRQQIIFIIHSEPKRKEAVLKQNYRCAGCGMKIERSYIKKFRYCEYLGKFFCHCCHANNMAYIPGRILWKWDFQQYYVSKFSWKLLDQMLYDPLFNVMDINPKLYRKIKQLDLCKEYRLQMFYLKNFIRTCRNCDMIQKELDQLAQHICSEPHIYAINDFLRVKSGDLPKLLGSLVSKCTSHVMQCPLCQAKGFFCEMCNCDDVIFPFQLAKVYRCNECGACFHKRCYKTGVCPKCIRIQERKRKQQKDVPREDEL